MGFYGNISNVNKTNMTFDKIYSNRKAMDESCALDGVYAGRYVLVEYEQYYPFDTLPIIYKLSSDKDKEGKFSTTYTQFSPLDIQENVIYRCVILTSWENDVIPEEDLLLQYYSNTFYRGMRNEKNDLFLQNISSEISEKNYVGNFNIDRIEYNTSRGYDSTVWMKQYDTNGIPRYVNIAELNSVIPTFDVSVDAPTMIPNSPHFDEDSTNIYYNLHVQPQWGFRVKEAEKNNDGETIFSDAMTKHVSIDYDKDGAEIITSTDVNADIYFNKNGFGENNKDAYVNLDDVGGDYIKITTNKSGKLYNSHKKGEPKKTASDIQELSIRLPSIGNMMSNAWDIIRGPERNNSPADSLQGRLNFFKNMYQDEIPVQSPGNYLVGSTVKDDKWVNATINIPNTSNLPDTDENKYHVAEGITLTHTTVDGFTDTQNNARALQSPSFGDSFNIPVITVDKAGHITSLEGDSSVQLPSNGSSLKLEGYSLSEDNTGVIEPKDDLITAFNKVENNKMDKENPSGSGAFSLNRKASSVIGNNSVAVGTDTIASGRDSHAEGYLTTAEGWTSHAEGMNTTASGNHSHAEGQDTTASNSAAHAEGFRTTASGWYSHAEGNRTIASGSRSHAEGYDTIASGEYSHAEGHETVAFGYSSHAEGDGSHISITLAGDPNATQYTVNNTSEETIKSGQVVYYNEIYAKIISVSDDGLSIILDKTLSADALTDTQAILYLSSASGIYSHAEGYDTIASGDASHAEGCNTIASGDYSHAEGHNTTVSGLYSHAEGYWTYGTGDYSHAEGWGAVASGMASHVEGREAVASGMGSHAEGYDTIASGDVSHVQGKCNLKDVDGIYQHIVGNGSSDTNRSNAHTLDWEGNAWFQGDVYIGSTSGINKDEGSLKLATEQYVYNNTTKTPITITIPAGLMLGDINKEGKITKEAGNLILKHVSKIETLSEDQQILADIDGDNKITVSDASSIMEIANNPSLLQEYGRDMLEIWSISSDDSAKEHPFYKDIILPNITEESSAVIAIQEACEPNNFVAICQNGYIRIYAKWLPIIDLKAIVFYGNGDGSAIVLCGSTDIDSKLSLSGGTITGKLKVEVSPNSDLEVVNKKYLDERVPLWTQENNGQSLCIIDNKPIWSKPIYTAEEVGALSANTIIPTVPTLISAFENDKGYLTEHQSLDEYAKTADIPNIVLNMSDFIALQNKVNELENRIAQLENPTTTE